MNGKMVVGYSLDQGASRVLRLWLIIKAVIRFHQALKGQINMKQHLSLEDLNSLSPKAKRRLNTWWKKNYMWKEIPGSTDGEMYGGGSYFEPRLSIGQLIQYLDEHLDNWLTPFDFGSRYQQEILLPVANELCDELWKEVRELLEK